VTVTKHVRHQSRAEISGEVDGVAGFVPKTCSQAKDKEEKGQGKHRTCSSFTHRSWIESSFSAKITNMSIVAVMNSEKKWLVFVKKA